MRKYLCVLTIALMGAGLTACDDDDDITGGDDLTEQEAAELAEVIFSQGFTMSTSADAADEFEGRPGLHLQAAAGVPIGPEDVPCELGGTVTVSGDVSGDIDETGAGTITILLTQDHNDCQVSSEQGTQFTLNGDPNTGMDLTIDVDADDNFTMNGTLDGGVAFLTSGKNGTCTIDITISASGNFQTGTASGTATGTACGHSVNEQFSE